MASKKLAKNLPNGAGAGLGWLGLGWLTRLIIIFIKESVSDTLQCTGTTKFDRQNGPANMFKLLSLYPLTDEKR